MLIANFDIIKIAKNFEKCYTQVDKKDEEIIDEQQKI